MRQTAREKRNMEDRSVCAPLVADSGAENNRTCPPNAASATGADTVTHTKIDRAQVQGEAGEEEMLRSLLKDDHCHVCDAVLLFESQRLSHYEGKKHAQKLRMYLQARKMEKVNKESTGPQRTMPTDKDQFCDLCNMVFSSHVVARSHYEGKVHSKNLRKRGLHPPDRSTETCNGPVLTQDPDIADQKSSTKESMEHPLDLIASTTTPSSQVALNDPDKYCALCAALFNNPQMALQHYNGRKHQRNQARHKLLKDLRGKDQEADFLKCQVCSLEFTSVEMYQAHMEGNKHQMREQKVTDLCKAPQKVYSTFADELLDYVQVQKARGLTPRTSRVFPNEDTQRDEVDDEEEDVLDRGARLRNSNNTMPNPPPIHHPPHHSHFGSYNSSAGWCPPYSGPPWPSYGRVYTCPPSVLPDSGYSLDTSRPMKRRRCRTPSSSSSSTTSSYSSSSSSSTSDTDDSEYRRREKRRIKRSRREKGKRTRDDDSVKAEKRRKEQRREGGKESKERRRGDSGDSEEERRRKKPKNQGKRRKQDNKSQEDEVEVRVDSMMDNTQSEDMMERKETQLHFQNKIKVEQDDGRQEVKTKHRKEKKKKEKVDTRTDEEKLWDNSILGW